MRRKLLSDSAATEVHQQSTIYIQDVSIRRSFLTGIQLTVSCIPVEKDLRKIYAFCPGDLVWLSIPTAGRVAR